MQFNLLRLLSNSGRRYIFDALSNHIYELDVDDDWDLITPEDLGYESDIRVNSLKLTGSKADPLTSAKTLIIELTESCNIRCTYCVFDEADSSERNHSEKFMTAESAYHAVDEFVKRTSGEECYLVFYGGEPLLRFSTMKEIVHYAQVASNDKFKFSFTTNGISLTSEKFEFLIRNDFKVTVSIDGPDFIHDKRRVTKGGRGTFSLVQKNLQDLQKYNPNYYSNSVDYNTVISDFEDVIHINKFYRDNSLFGRDKVRFSPEISVGLNVDRKISQSVGSDELRSALVDKRPVYFKSNPNGYEWDLDPVQDAFIGNILKKINHRDLGSLAIDGKKICIPFANRTYIRVDGSIQFCERIQNYKIKKSVDDMVVFSKKINDEFIDFKFDSCSKCFAYNFCDMCPASFVVNGALSKELSEIKCLNFRDNFKRAMLIYINSMELREGV
ncbi:MAG: radical SAM protein [Hydrogenophaga sp.]|uniref:radical SAM protein n=1 Tax=Hydrogenophaga sp. TaxID=1904254 RepID=UPI0027604AAA|nr:radical SAM protein [Hydrogenophaga sp.]MDP2417401.1 radical SAM protein [Hydrogenophaga sp.]MDZ4186775.1 radical SAM protein [Hydrogenophaga sp.]